MITFRQIMEDVAPNIGTGYDPSSDEARRMVRRAILLLLTEFPILLEKNICLYAYGDILVLPENIDAVKKYWLGGNVRHPAAPIYEFMESGPGMSFESFQSHNVLVDRGESPVIYQPPDLLYLEIMSDRTEEQAEVVVRGLDENGNEVRSDNGTVGERFLIGSGNQLIRSRKKFKTITSVVKSATKGYVSLYSVDPDNSNAQYFLSQYSPSLSVAGFKTYRIPGVNFDASSNPLLTQIYCLVRLRRPDLKDDDDILPFDDSMAVEAIARSVYLLRNGKYKEAQVEGQTGFQIAAKTLKLKRPHKTQPDIQCAGYCMNDVEGL